MLNSAIKTMQHKTMKRSQGIAMTETLVALPVLLLLVLGGIQLALMWEAKIVLNHAALMAARAGALNRMDFGQMYAALDRNNDLLERDPTFGVRPIREIAKIHVLNPTSDAFFEHGIDLSTGAREIPNSSLKYRDRSASGPSRVSIQDANILRIMVVYQFEMVVPIVNSMLDYITKSRGAVGSVGDLPTIPITAVATLRMQTPPTIPAGTSYIPSDPIPFTDIASNETSYILDLECVQFLSQDGTSSTCGVADITGDWDKSTDYNSELVYYGNKN